MDGLDIYGSEYLRIRFQSAVLEKIAKLEEFAQMLSGRSLSRASFVENNHLLVGRFLPGVQNLLATTSEGRDDFTPWSSRFSNKDFAIILWEFYQVPTDFDKIQILSQCLEDWDACHPFLSLAGLRSVSCLARMLDPNGWGCTTWRTLACLGFESMTELKKARLFSSPASIQDEFPQLQVQDVVNATLRMRQLLHPELPTTASVAAALFSISLDLWPTGADIERKNPSAVVQRSSCSSSVLS